MKRFLAIITAVCLLFCLSACDIENVFGDKQPAISTLDTSSNTVSSLQENIKKLSGKKLDLSSEESRNPIGIKGELFYFESVVDNKNNTGDVTICMYNLTTQKTTILGTLNSCTTASAKYAFLDGDKIFRTQGVAVDDSEVNFHMMIDASENKINILRRDDFFPPLVDTYTVNSRQYLEYQPESLDNEGGYRYHVRIGNENGEVKEIITKKRDLNGGTTLISVSTYNNVIYTLEYTDAKYNICSYDLNGLQLSCEGIGIVTEFANMPDELTGEQDPLWSMDVINGYYFFSSAYGRKLVIHKTEAGYSKNEYLSTTEITRVTCNTAVDANRVVFYDYGKQVLVVFNTNTQSRIEYRLEAISPSPYLTTDGQRVIYSDADGNFRVATINK